MSFSIPFTLNLNNPVVPEEGYSPRIYPRKHDRSDLLKWPILQMLPAEFLANIHMAFVYGSEALLVTNSDKVYAVGKNSLGCLEGAKSGEDSLFHPREVQELSGKNIKTFCYCKDSVVVALGSDGTMYYSEGVGFIVIRMEDSSSGIFKQKLNVRSIAYQQGQIFALLEDGQIYIWKKDMPSITLTGRKIFAYIHKCKITHIECTHSACIAVTAEGELYTYNNSPGTSPVMQAQQDSLQRLFTKVDLPSGVKIEKIACGYQHVLALSETGLLYTWGSTASGQLGYLTGSIVGPFQEKNIIENIPQQVSIPTMGRVVDIAATHRCHISVAATSCGKIFMWGDCGGVIVRTPIVTPYTSMHEVFGKFARMKLMHQPLVVDINCESCNVLNTLESAFDDPETSDFVIEVEGKPIHVHKAILKINSEYFRKMFATDWVENKKDVLEHTEFSYDVYKAFLKYLYTGRVGLPPRDALELLRLANQYLDIRLQRLCEQSIVNGLGVSNALHVFVTARQHAITDLEEISLTFIMNHLTAVVESEDFLSLDGGTTKELIRKAAGKGVFKK